MTAQLLMVGEIYRQYPAQALEMLNDPDACPPEFRDDFAWRHYYSHCQRWRVTWEWPGMLDAIAVSPDGQLLATSQGKVITLWELNTGKRVTTLERHTRTVTRLTFSPNSRVLATGAQEVRPAQGPQPGVEVKLWDVATAKPRFEFSTKEKDLETLTFSADGKVLAAEYQPKSVRAWEVESGRELAQAPDLVDRVALPPDLKPSLIHPLGNGTMVRRVREAGERFFAHRSVAVAPDGKTIATLFLGSNVIVWDGDKRQEQFAIQEPPGEVREVSFTDSGRGLALVERLMAGNGRPRGATALRIWSLDPHPEPLIIPDGGGIAFLPDGKGVVTAVGGKLKHIEVPTGADETLAEGLDNSSVVLAASSDGTALALLEPPFGRPSKITVWDVASRSRRFTHEVTNEGDATAGRFSPDGTRVVVHQRNSGVKLLDAKTGEDTGLKFPEVCGVAFAPDGQTLAVGGPVTPLQLWDLRTGETRRTFSNSLTPLGFLSDDNLLLVQEGARFKVWDLRKDEEHTPFLLPKVESPPVFTPDGKSLITLGADIEVRDPTTGQVRLRIPALGLARVAFSPDSRFMAVAETATAQRRDVRVWDTQAIKEAVFRPGR